VDSYRTLDVWKISHEATGLVYRSCDDAYHPRSKSVLDQLKRATLSVEANVVEGYALGTAALCARHFRIAFGSAAEAECIVRHAGELGYLKSDVCKEVEGLLSRVMQMLRRLMRKPPYDARRTTHVNG